MQTLKEIWAYRQMIISLVRKDLRGRYKGSVLGFLWTFLNPLLQLIVYTVVFAVILQSNIENYYLFLFVALVPWIFFSASVQGGATSILNQKGMVTKIHFPREVLPISHVITCFVNMLLTFVIIFIVIIVTRTPINFQAIVFLPVFMLVEFIFCLGMATLVSCITVYFRDLEYILGILIMAWQFLTPIMYSIDIVPESLHGIFAFNPMTPIVVGYREILYYAQIPHLSTLAQAFLLGIAFLIIGFFTFSKLKKRFAEEL